MIGAAVTCVASPIDLATDLSRHAAYNRVAFMPVRSIVPAVLGVLLMASAAAAQAALPAHPKNPGPDSAKATCRAKIYSMSLRPDQHTAEMRVCLSERRARCLKQADVLNIPRGRGERREFATRCMQGT